MVVDIDTTLGKATQRLSATPAQPIGDDRAQLSRERWSRTKEECARFAVMTAACAPFASIISTTRRSHSISREAIAEAGARSLENSTNASCSAKTVTLRFMQASCRCPIPVVFRPAHGNGRYVKLTGRPRKSAASCTTSSPASSGCTSTTPRAPSARSKSVALGQRDSKVDHHRSPTASA